MGLYSAVASCPCGHLFPPDAQAEAGTLVCPACGRFVPVAEAAPPASALPLPPVLVRRWEMTRPFSFGEQILEARDLTGGEPLKVTWQLQNARSLAARGLALLVMVGGIASSTYALKDRLNVQDHPLVVTAYVLAILCSLAGGLALGFVIAPRRPFLLSTLGELGQPLLWLRKDSMGFWRTRYAVLAPDGASRGSLLKSRFSWLLPRPWKLEGPSGEPRMEVHPVLSSLNWRLMLLTFFLTLIFCCWLLILIFPLLTWSQFASSQIFTRYEMRLPDGRVAGGLIQDGFWGRKWSLAWGGQEADGIPSDVIVLAAALVILNPTGAR